MQIGYPTRLFFLLFLAVLFAVSSCTPQRKLVYLQGEQTLVKDSARFAMPVSPGDILLVQLVTVNPEAFPALGVVSANNEGNDNRSAYEKGLVVNPQGMLDLPYVGSIRAAGLTMEVLHDTLVARFSRLIDEPVVILKKLSFKVSVLGEVNRPGLYYVPNEQLTFLEALALAGDLNNYADRTGLKLFRKTPEGTIEYKLDLTSKDALSGPFRYMHPDDVIYAPPTRKKAFTAITPATAVVTSLLTAVALIATAYFRSQ
jgi:polysaccharide export outer membrane protein